MNHIAIIIPYYKLTFFRECLESLAAQTDHRFTVYIGDDASPENPEYLLKEYEGKFNFIYKKFRQNIGGSSLTKQWERCIKMMQGEEWFMILGDDDYLDDDCVAGFYETIVNSKKDWKVLRYKLQVINEKKKANSEIIEYTDEETAADFIVKRSKGLVRSSLSEYVFKTTDFQQYGITAYPNAFYSDNMMVLQYSEFGPIKNIALGIVLIRVSDLSITGNKDNSKNLTGAGYLFYTDLLTKHHNQFTKFHKKYFLAPMFEGYLQKKTELSFSEVYHIILENSNIWVTMKFFSWQIKHTIYNLIEAIKIINFFPKGNSI